MEHEEDAQAVLRDVVNEEVSVEEDGDFALAKMMQEQERAFFHARHVYGYGENELGHFDPGLLRDEQDSEDEGEDEASTGSGGASSSGEDTLGAAESTGEVVDDEELARRLHVQEQIDHQRRMMELAGIAPDGEVFSDEDEEGYLTDDSVDPDEMTYEELRALGDAVGVVSRGASVDVIKALPFARYVGQGKAEGRPAAAAAATAVCSHACGQDEQCVVCRMEFENGEDIKVLPCKHVFHPECIDQWLVINKACPICGSEVTITEGRESTEVACLKTGKHS